MILTWTKTFGWVFLTSWPKESGCLHRTGKKQTLMRWSSSGEQVNRTTIVIERIARTLGRKVKWTTFHAVYLQVGESTITGCARSELIIANTTIITFLKDKRIKKNCFLYNTCVYFITEKLYTWLKEHFLFQRPKYLRVVLKFLLSDRTVFKVKNLVKY